MKYLNLPIVREKPSVARWLTMDRYLRFVIDNLKYTVNIAAARKSKQNLPVEKRFILK